MRLAPHHAEALLLQHASQKILTNFVYVSTGDLPIRLRRERHPSPTVDDIIHPLNGAKKFSKLDLRSGYHQLVPWHQNHETSRPLPLTKDLNDTSD